MVAIQQQQYYIGSFYDGQVKNNLKNPRHKLYGQQRKQLLVIQPYQQKQQNINNMRRKANPLFSQSIALPQLKHSIDYDSRSPQSSIYTTPMKKRKSYVPDSLEMFQRSIDKNILFSNSRSKTNNRKKFRRHTEAAEEEESTYKKTITQIQNEIKDLKVQILLNKQSNRFEDKLDEVMIQMLKSKVSTPAYQPPPYPYHLMNQSRYINQARSRRLSTIDSRFSGESPYGMPRSKNRIRRLLRKAIFAVAFPIFLRSEAKKLASKRKSTLQIFYRQKFNLQMLQLKNWLVDGLSFMIPVVLEKQKIQLNFWQDKRQQISKEKQLLLLHLVKIGLFKMRQECTPKKVSLFAQILHNLCSSGSFAMSRFWSAYQMRNICISQYFGFVRADESLQKFMLGQVVIIKVLAFNLLLQPHKFDSQTFPRGRQPISNNMHIIASVYYRLARQILRSYLERIRPPYYKLGNWLTVKQQFIVECCSPMMFNVEYPDEDQPISGMVGEELQVLEESIEWEILLGKMADIIDGLYREMKRRRRDVVRNQKYKLYC